MPFVLKQRHVEIEAWEAELELASRRNLDKMCYERGSAAFNERQTIHRLLSEDSEPFENAAQQRTPVEVLRVVPLDILL